MAEASMRYPRTIVALVLFLLAASLGTLTDQKTLVGPRAQLGREHPAVKDFDRFIDQFGGGYPVLIGWACGPSGACDSALDDGSLLMAARVASGLDRLPYVRAVASPATSPLLVAEPGGGLAVRHLVEDGSVVPDREGLALLALQDPTWLGNVVSADGLVGALVVEMNSADSEEIFLAVDAIDAELASFRALGFEFFLLGQPVVETAILETAATDGILVGLCASVVIFVVILGLTRSWQAVLAVMLNVGCATAAVFGLMGVAGWPLDPVTTAVSSMVLVVAAADAIHLLSAYAHFRIDDSDPRRALASAARSLAAPCLMTTLTTASAFVSLWSSDVLGLARFGVLAAAGVGFAFLFCFSLLPAVLVLLPVESSTSIAHSSSWRPIVRGIGDLAIGKWKLVIALALPLGLMASMGLGKIRTEVDIYSYWEPGEAVPQALRFFERKLRKPDSLELELRLPSQDSIYQPATVRSIHDFSRRAERVPGLGRARSVVDNLLVLREATGADTGPGELPTSPQEVGELLMLASVGGGEVLDPWLSIDGRQARISLEAGRLLQADRIRVFSALQGLIATHIPADWEVVLTGPLMLSQASVESIRRTQLRSFSIAALLVFLLLVVFLRSIGWGLFALVPNLLPVAILLGAMGSLGIALDVGTSMVAPLALGIAVDDTIHVMSRYLRHRRDGDPGEAAIRKAVESVGRALVTTSLALSLGFSTMLVSSFQSVANIGLLSALAVAGALVADLILLPAMVSGLGWISRPRPRANDGG
jgi:hypothetical protein